MAEEGDERRKLSELVNEIRGGDGVKEGTKLTWMYKGPADLIDREEYLLGKSVDKNFETISKGIEGVFGDQEHSNIPKRLLGNSERVNHEQVDIEKKIHEDPLYAIRQKEMEARKKLLSNPVKLKQIKEMIARRDKLKAKEESDMKRQKRKNESVDDAIMRKLLKLKTNKTVKTLKDVSLSDDVDSDDGRKERREERNTNVKVKYKHEKRKRSKVEKKSSKRKLKDRGGQSRKHKVSSSDESSSSSTSSSESDESSSSSSESSFDRRRQKVSRSKSEDKKKSSRNESTKKQSKKKEIRKKRKHEESSSESDDEVTKPTGKGERTRKRDSSSEDGKGSEVQEANVRHRGSGSDEDRGRKRKSYGLVRADGSVLALSRNTAVPRYEKKAVEAPRYVKPATKHLSELEKQTALKEMMENAKVRKVDRETNLSRHRREAARRDEKPQQFDDQFLRRQLSLAQGSHSSVADRIKSNINNIQRSKVSMDSNFVRK